VLESEAKAMRHIRVNSGAFVKALEDKGWHWEGQTIYAPHRSMWLSELDSWLNDIAGFQERMEARRDRIKANRQHHTDQQQHEHVVDDVEGLLRAIEEVIGETEKGM
jgi:uncharacterized membrane protein YccC